MATGIPATPASESPLVEVPGAGARRVRRWGLTIALGSFLFGYDTGVVSGALLFIRRVFHLNAFEQGAVVSVLLLGAIVGALLSGRVADRIGRRWALFGLGVVFAVGILVAALAVNYWMLLVGRVVMGLAVGGVSANVPTYLSELAPPQIRGRVLTLNQLLITVGLLVSYLVDMAFSGSENWRAMFGVGAVPAIALAIGCLWLPESPTWLVMNHRFAQARTVVESVVDATDADRMIERYRRQEATRLGERGHGAAVRGMRALRAPHVRAALVVAVTLAAMQQFVGINTIIYYAPTIMVETGLSASNAIVYSVFIGAINLAMTIVSLRLVDRIGRRPLLLGSLIGMLVTLALLGLSFVAHLGSVTTLVFMLLYIVFFAVGMGPIFWVLLGEIFPHRERAEGAAVGSTVNWLSNFIVSLVFLPVVNAIGQGETFWIFAVVCAFGLWFVYHYVPETREREFEELDADLQARWRHRAVRSPPSGKEPAGPPLPAG
ncbi:sugar porter family MFS transporter [Planosporangium thailandense]|uniref:Sugar porter family MFS transporter n=1 Tax=Planosporangium thailandense TaxID=765197 RepID=A0ABX0Y1G4_9ACTN|nr:sugar porter family MFS transporter [Planosporangium thailandense]NJC71270.1 sugar porter family MFS transporter [Planosporangium thailandense]